MLPALFAAIGAVLIGAGIAIQQLVAAEQDSHAVLDPRLMVRLIQRRRWLMGFAFGNVGFGFQAAAIASGRLVLIEPITATNVLFALLISANRTGRRLGPREWRGAIAAIVGVGGFLAIAAPSEGEHGDPAVPWSVPLLILAIVVVVAVSLARRSEGSRRAVTLAVAAGLGFGVSDGIFKLITDVAEADGVGALPGHWGIYAWMIASPMAFVLQQNAFHSAHIGASMPATSTLSPVTAAFLGALMFDEQVRGGWWLLPEAAFAVVLVVGVVTLASSPLIEIDADDIDDVDDAGEPVTSP